MAKAKNSKYEADLRKRLKEAFDEVDTDKSGTISKDELKVMLSKAGYEATDKVAKVSSLTTPRQVFRLFPIQTAALDTLVTSV